MVPVKTIDGKDLAKLTAKSFRNQFPRIMDEINMAAISDMKNRKAMTKYQQIY